MGYEVERAMQSLTRVPLNPLRNTDVFWHEHLLNQDVYCIVDISRLHFLFPLPIFFFRPPISFLVFCVMFSPVRARSLSVQAPLPPEALQLAQTPQSIQALPSVQASSSPKAPYFFRIPERVQVPQAAQAPQPVQEASDTNLKHTFPHPISTTPQEPGSTAMVLAPPGDPFTRLEEGQIFESSIITAESVRSTSRCSRQSG